MRVRPRRNRAHPTLRKMIRENELAARHLVLPLFVQEGQANETPISSMPGQSRLSLDLILRRAEEVVEAGISGVALFPSIPDDEKDTVASASTKPDGLLQRTIRALKSSFPELLLITDVALDPYSSDGHDGVLIDGRIDNDQSLPILAAMAVSQAEAGADIVAPSDMMDGRIGKIRKALDKNKFQNVQILSYAAKYASSFYGPFRDAVGSKGSLKGDKKTYQMDYRNSDEALREVALDIKEGADMVMVKPGMPYLDIIKSIKEKFKLPVFAYQVSGEYSLIQTAIKKKLINKDAIYESLVAFKRAGANAIVSYYADRIDKIIK